jgi:hypothetical protein
MLAGCALFPVAAQADNTVGAKVSTLGLGLEFATSLSANTNLRFGVQGFNHDYTSTESGVEYNFDMKLRSAGLVLDWHPFADTFHTSVGAFYNGNKLEMTSRTTGSVVVGNTTYPAGTSVTGEVTFQKAAPYFGVGWGRSARAKGISPVFDIGVLYQGSPDVTLRSSAVSQADLDNEAAQAEDALKNYKWFPVLSFSLGYKF